MQSFVEIRWKTIFVDQRLAVYKVRSTEEEAEREDYSSPAVPVDPLLLENSESVDILSTNTSTITTTITSTTTHPSAQ